MAVGSDALGGTCFFAHVVLYGGMLSTRSGTASLTIACGERPPPAVLLERIQAFLLPLPGRLGRLPPLLLRPLPPQLGLPALLLLLPPPHLLYVLLRVAMVSDLFVLVSGHCTCISLTLGR